MTRPLTALVRVISGQQRGATARTRLCDALKCAYADLRSPCGKRPHRGVSPKSSAAAPRPDSGGGARGEHEHSAGGVVLKGGEVLVVVPTRRAASGARVLALPKGHLDGEETAEQAARREVREEGGVEVDLIEPLGDVRYRYKRDGRLVNKRVTFFLFRYRSGSPDDHDHEIEEARWMALGDAARELTYAGERGMLARALSKTPPAR